MRSILLEHGNPAGSLERGPVRRLHSRPTMKRVCLLLALASAGFTDCQYFSQVPVVTTETTPPIVGARMWIDGVESMHTGDNVAHSNTGDVVIAPYVFDGGGARTLQLFEQTVEVYCHDDDADPDLGQFTEVRFVDQTSSQPAATAGQLRSNGIYLILPVTDLADFERDCRPGFDLVDVRYSWSVRGVDYSGNQSVATGTVTYVP